jgi:hypothetical protein
MKGNGVAGWLETREQCHTYAELCNERLEEQSEQSIFG